MWHGARRMRHNCCAIRARGCVFGVSMMQIVIFRGSWRPANIVLHAHMYARSENQERYVTSPQVARRVN